MSLSFLENAHGERYLHEVNRRDFVAEASPTVLEHRLDLDLDAENTLHVIVGSDSGLLLEHLCRRGLGAGSEALLVEAEDYHAAIVAELRRRGAGELFGREDVRLRPAGDWLETLTSERLLQYANAGTVLVAESLGCRSDHAGVYATLLRETRLALEERVHLLNAHLNARFFLARQIENLADNRVPAAVLRGVGEGRAAVVLGGGPSLDRHTGWIRDNRERLCVFAASRLGGRLAELGLEPDVVVAVDPQEGLYDISKRALLAEGTPFVCANHVVPRLLQEWRGPSLYLGTRSPWHDDEADNVAAVGSTVSHVATWLAHEWGFAPILLAGVDLCYAAGGGTHASGSLEALVETLPSNYDAEVVTYAGRRAGTSRPLKHGVHDLELIGEQVNANGPRLFNLSDDAARVDSVPYADPATIELPASRARIAPDMRAEDAAEHFRRVIEETGEARRSYRGIRALCGKAQRCLDGLYGHGGRAPDYRCKRRLDRVERELERGHGARFALIKRFAGADFARITPPSGFEDMSDAEAERWGRDYYRIVAKAATQLTELAESAHARARIRLAELEEEADANALIDAWERDGTPGRVMLHGPRLRAGADAATVARIDAAVDAFLASLRADDTAYARRLDAHKRDPRNVLRTIRFLFQQENVEDLGLLVAGLPGFGEPFTLFGELAQGLLDELAGGDEAALARYGAVIDALGARLEGGEALSEVLLELLEDTLLRVNHISLLREDAASAETALGLLAGLSPAYAVPHAKILALGGHLPEALAALEGHIGSHPEDWRAIGELGKLYARAGAADAARVAEALAAQVRKEGRAARRAA